MIDSAGAASSSAMVSVASAGSATPLAPETAAETVSCLSGSSFALSNAVIVTAPTLAVAPAAMVSVTPELSVKSAATAGATAVADTVSITASLDLPESVAVTVLVSPWPLSAMVSSFDESGSDNAKVATGVASSSVSASDAPVTVPAPWLFRAVPLTVVERPPTLSTSSSTAVIVTASEAFAVAPAAMTMVASEPTV